MVTFDHVYLPDGSSPHARGARAGRDEPARAAGLIPACAGSTRRRGRSRGSGWAHPRMRGEHRYGVREVFIPLGSSPHARGAPATAETHRIRGGLIPACAGSTSRRARLPRPAWAHPRMRGEHYQPAGIVHADEGSSPHARGARALRSGGAGVTRLIPACAGSTRARSQHGRRRTAHPRMRGEHHRRADRTFGAGGSSPHARGARWDRRPRRAAQGLIPACAGSTSSGRAGRSAARAHPRMRGEHATIAAGTVIVRGSSPHARGAPRGVLPGGARRGLIPACAGSTRVATTWTTRLSAHPRMRGEHYSENARERLMMGSSPHARGARGRRGRPRR